ncbi:Eco57I restriction-modification methylase domain-containing protein [Egbenema bharatensis]|uniref:Eco57I restriction-modification methylase domain-containing protein n=1 Tax=Egbenema bharatensis TaxID=3463334 RepID=UPI003A8885E1
MVRLNKEIHTWRNQLLAYFRRQYPELAQTDLDAIAQAAMNALLLLRLCEERGIQPWHHLAERVQPILDPHLSSKLSLEDVLQSQSADRGRILREEGEKLPIERLGQVYEQFLAKGRSAAQKAGGAYYTPRSVVDYMVQHTVGDRLMKSQQGRDALQGDWVTLRVLDPACGSGAFLLGVYQFLLNWYQTHYVAAIDRYHHQLYRSNGEWRLTFETRKQILLQHIYGVDLDPQAIEITRQSLLLQLLEGITEEKRERDVGSVPVDPALLDQNICCGNALIGSDFYEKADENLGEINVFDWEQAFPEVMRSGGFDGVIGNPPWVFTRNVKFGDRVKQYYQRQYLGDLHSLQQGKTKQTGKINLFVLFLIRFIQLTNQQGTAGIIVPNTLLRTTVYDVARQYILEHCEIQRIVDLGSEVFAGVTASTAMLILGKNPEHTAVQCFDGIRSSAPRLLDKRSFVANPGYVFSIFVDQAQEALFHRLEECSSPLSKLTKDIIEGIVCQRNQVTSGPQPDRHKKLLEGKDITRYTITFREKYILFDRQQLHRPRPEYVWAASEKLVLRRIGGGRFPLIAALDTNHYYTFASVNNLLMQEHCPYNIRYLLALLNSKLLNYYYSQKFTNRSRLTVNIAKTFVQQLPIRTIDFNSPIEVEQHDRLVHAVDTIQALYTQSALVHSDQRQWIHQEIERVDRQIDAWVNQLYGLTAAEVSLIQAGFPDSFSRDRSFS